MKMKLVAENNYKTKTAEERAEAVTRVVERIINKKLEQASAVK